MLHLYIKTNQSLMLEDKAIISILPLLIKINDFNHLHKLDIISFGTIIIIDIVNVNKLKFLVHDCYHPSDI